MTRVNNLWDLHKKRIFSIDQDQKGAVLVYEDFSITSIERYLFETEKVFNLECIQAKMMVSWDDRRRLRVKIVTEKPSLNGLWRVAMALAFILGDGITVEVFTDAIPYYPIPRFLNIGGGEGSSFVRSDFARNPKKIIETIYQLLDDENSFFGKMLAPMLQINTLNFFDIRFFCEFVIIERLSKDQYSENLIVQEIEARAHLKSILESSWNSIAEDNSFNEKQRLLLKRKLSIESINSKSSTKERMTAFVEGLGSEFMEYVKDVEGWGRLRNEGIAHGASLSSKMVMNESDVWLEKRLHNFLFSLLYKELRHAIDDYPVYT